MINGAARTLGGLLTGGVFGTGMGFFSLVGLATTGGSSFVTAVVDTGAGNGQTFPGASVYDFARYGFTDRSSIRCQGSYPASSSSAYHSWGKTITFLLLALPLGQ